MRACMVIIQVLQQRKYFDRSLAQDFSGNSCKIIKEN